MSEEYTPTTDDIRNQWATDTFSGTVYPECFPGFDRWLAARDAGIRKDALADVIECIEHWETVEPQNAYLPHEPEYQQSLAQRHTVREIAKVLRFVIETKGDQE